MNACIDDIYLISRRQSKKRFRARIYESWNGRCAYCGAIAKSLDHVVPRHKGGLTIIENLVPACLSCNGHKGAEDWVQWYRKQDFYTVERETMIWFWITQYESNNAPDSLFASELFSLLLPVKQCDFLARFNVIDNTSILDGAVNSWLD